MEIRDGFDDFGIRLELYFRAVAGIFELRFIRYAFELAGLALGVWMMGR